MQKVNPLILISFILYLLLLAAAVFMGERRKENDVRLTNFTPVTTIVDNINSIESDINVTAYNVYSNLFGNIILFMPLPVFLVALFRLNNLQTMLVVACSSIFIEAVQYLCKLGVTDINDLILNFTGGLIGLIIVRIVLLFLSRPPYQAIKTHH